MIELYRHQKVALALMRFNPQFALFLEQGCGKTLIVLSRISEMIDKGELNSALVICPKAVIGSWQRDMNKFDDPTKFINRVEVINYDLVWRRKEIYSRHWDMIVLDESHYIKCRTTNRAKCILNMAMNSDYRYILTGTPISNGSLEDIFSQFAFLKPSKTKRSIGCEMFGGYYDFLDEYCYLNKYHKPYKYRNVDKLQDIINEYSYRVTKAECLDLPDKLPNEIYDIELKEPKMYKELMKDSVLMDYEFIAGNPLVKMAKVRQILSGFFTDEQGEIHPLKCEKLNVLDEFLDGYHKKLVIFAEFKESIRQINELLTKKKIRHLTLDGEQKDKTIWTEFQNDESIKVIVCQYKSACAGIDLFASDTILYYEPTLSSNVFEQSKDRIHRIGQKSKCSYICFVTKHSMESAIYKALDNYEEFNEKLFTEYMEEWQKSYGY